jgi:hypothetical protein
LLDLAIYPFYHQPYIYHSPLDLTIAEYVTAAQRLAKTKYFVTALLAAVPVLRRFTKELIH